MPETGYRHRRWRMDIEQLGTWAAAWAAGSGAYVSVLRAAERVLGARGISNASLSASALGLVSVAVASAVAGQVSSVAYEAANAVRMNRSEVERCVRNPAAINWHRVQAGALQALRAGLSADRVETDVVVGVILYKFSGLLSPAPGVLRRFADVAPSDLHRPGRFSKAVLPAKDDSYATDSARELIRAVGRRVGCHSCGSRRAASYHGDHQPPNSLARPGQAQFFYSQCDSCSNSQGGLLSSFDGKGRPPAAPVLSNLGILHRIRYQPWLPTQLVWLHGLPQEAKVVVKRCILEGLDATERVTLSAEAALQTRGRDLFGRTTAAAAGTGIEGARHALRSVRDYVDRRMLPSGPTPAPPPPRSSSPPKPRERIY